MSAAVLRSLTPAQRAKLADASAKAVAESFAYAPVAERTAAEVRRRSNICLDLVGVLRGDLRWSIPKTADHVGVYLRCELLGIAYDPSKNTRGAWTSDETVEDALVRAGA